MHFVGKPAGVAEGGILAPLAREVEVECLPLEIPEFFDVDVTALGIHDVIHVSAMKFAGNVKPIFDTDYPVVGVLPPTVEALRLLRLPPKVAAPRVLLPPRARCCGRTGRREGKEAARRPQAAKKEEKKK